MAGTGQPLHALGLWTGFNKELELLTVLFPLKATCSIVVLIFPLCKKWNPVESIQFLLFIINLIPGIHHAGCYSFLTVCEPAMWLKSSIEYWLMTFRVNGIESAVEWKKSLTLPPHTSANSFIHTSFMFLLSHFYASHPTAAPLSPPEPQIYSVHQWTHPPSTLRGTPEPKLSDSLAPKFNISSRGTSACIDFSPWKWTLGAISHPGDGQRRVSLTTPSPIFSRPSLSSDLLLLLTRRPADLLQWQLSTLSCRPSTVS